MKIKREQLVLNGAGLEVRVASENGVEQRRIGGYAAVFDSWSEDMGGWRERIAPGAFAKTLQESDVRALVNHDPNYVLGRTRSGTLKLWEDERGLAFEVTPPDVQWARDLMVTIGRNDMDQSSFGFRTIRDSWGTGQGNQERTLLEVALFDVSVVTFPAYASTEVGLRAWSTTELYVPRPPELGHLVAEPQQALHLARRRRMALEQYEDMEV